MSLKMKLTASISALILVLGFMLMGIMAVNQATVNMGGSISFTATDVYAHVTGSIVNDTSSPSNLDVTYSAEETQGDPTIWNDLNLAFDSKATPVEVTITVENLSQQNTLRVNLNDTLSSTIGNLEKVVKNDGGDYTNRAVITLQPNGQENDSTTFTITMSVKDKNTSLTADFDYKLALEDQYYEGAEETVYERVDAEGNPDPNGTYLLFGWYPQTVKSADVTVGSTPESNGYYLGSDGAYYMKATAQVDSDPSGGTYDNFKDGTSITQGTEYYFKMEKLKWRILTENYEGSGNALIVCDTIVDMVSYQSNYIQSGSYYYATDEDGTILTDPTATVGQGVDSNHQVYANNYEHSEIREYLNGTFYDTAFNAEEKSYIVTTTVDNSFESIYGSYSANSGYTEDTFNYECRDTEDNVFLLSLSDVNNTEYGFKDSYEDIIGGSMTPNMFDTARAFYTSDFSRAMGAATITETTLSQLQSMGVPEEDIPLYLGSGAGWLRSPYGIRNGRYAFDVVYGFYADNNVDNDSSGAVPALQIQLS